MLIFYRGFGLVWGLLGILILPVVFLLTLSLGAALSTVAAFWIYFGRGHHEPRWFQEDEKPDRRIAPAVFFIPVWVYGTLMIPLALGGLVLDLTQRPAANAHTPVGLGQVSEEQQRKASFDEANGAIASAKRGAVHGNTELARKLAGHYSGVLKQISKDAFSGGKEGVLSRTDGEFVVYCQANDDESVLFLVHVPELRQYKGDVRDALSVLTWKAAQELVLAAGAPDDIELAIALRGTLLYGPIMIDRVSVVQTADDWHQEDLFRFFAEQPDQSKETQSTEELATATNTADSSDQTFPAEVDSASSTVPPRAAIQPRTTPKRTAARISTPEGPGKPVTANTELAPGQKLAGYWGGVWSQVVVTGVTSDHVLTGWVHSNSWKSYRMSRHHLRLVNDEQFAECKQNYHDLPVSLKTLAAEDQVNDGVQLLCQVSAYWLPVQVTGPETDEGIPIHWIGFNDRFDEYAKRDRLSMESSTSAVRTSRLQSATSVSGGAPGRPVTIDTELRPGQKLAGRWGGKWYQVIVTGIRSEDSVLTAWVQSNTWTSFGRRRTDLRLVTDQEFDSLPHRYNDTPVAPRPVTKNQSFEVGQKLLCAASGFWLPVEIVDVGPSGKVRIHWLNFSDQFDEDVDASRLFEKKSR